MSKENVEIVRRGFEGFLAGDIPRFLGTLDPTVEWKQVEEPTPRYGPAGVLAALAQWEEMWDEPRYEAEEYIDAGEQVVLHIKITGRGKTSGVEVEMSSYLVFSIRQSRVTRMHEVGSERAEALEAAGRSE